MHFDLRAKLPAMPLLVAETSRFGVPAALVPGPELPHRPQGRRRDVLLSVWEREIPLNSAICHWFNRLCLHWPRHHIMVAGFNWPVPLTLPNADRQAALRQRHVPLLVLPNGVVYLIVPVNAEGNLEAVIIRCGQAGAGGGGGGDGGGDEAQQQPQVHLLVLPNGADHVIHPPNTEGNLEAGGAGAGGGGGGDGGGDEAQQQPQVHLLVLPNGVDHVIRPPNTEGNLEALIIHGGQIGDCNAVDGDGGNHVLQPLHQAQVHVFLLPNGAKVVCDPPTGGNLAEVVVFGSGGDGGGAGSSDGGGGHNVVQPLQDPLGPHTLVLLHRKVQFYPPNATPNNVEEDDNGNGGG